MPIKSSFDASVKAMREQIPAASARIFFTTRDQMWIKPRGMISELVSAGKTTDQIVRMVYARMTGIPLPAPKVNTPAPGGG